MEMKNRSSKFIISQIILSITLLATTSQAQKFTRGQLPLSDHYNGKVFLNPWMTSKQFGFFDFVLMSLEIQKATWPDFVLLKNPEVPPATENSMDQIHYHVVNHSTVIIQMEGLNIITDPILSKRSSPVQWAGPKRVFEAVTNIDNMPNIDVVLISHNHYDHMDVDTILQIDQKFKPLFIVPLGNESFLRKRGIKNVIELDWWEQHEYKKFQFTLTPAQHFSARGLFDRNETLWGGFVVMSPLLKKVYFAGDTGYAPFFKEIRARLGSMDLSFIPIGAYEPRWFMQSMHLNPEDAVQAHLDLESGQSVGIHFGTFQLTAESIDDPPKKLAEALAQKQIDPSLFIAPEFSKNYQLQLIK